MDPLTTLDELPNAESPNRAFRDGTSPNAGSRSCATSVPAGLSQGRSSTRARSTPAEQRSLQAANNGRLVDDPQYRLLLTIPEACAALAVSRDAVYELLRSGRLPSVTLGRSRRIRIADLERFVAGLPRTAA